VYRKFWKGGAVRGPQVQPGPEPRRAAPVTGQLGLDFGRAVWYHSSCLVLAVLRRGGVLPRAALIRGFMYCFRRDVLESGHEVFFMVRSSEKGRELCEVELWLHGIVLGTFRLKGSGGWEAWFEPSRFLPTCIDEAVDYYVAKHPDLAGADRKTLLHEGFAREIDLTPIIDRATETLEALYQPTDEGPFLVIDADGQVLLETNLAEEARHVTRQGRKVWFSKDRVDEQTLRVVPARKFAAERKTENLERGGNA